MVPGLPEQGSEHDPTARSSHEPELPVAEETGEESVSEGTGYRWSSVVLPPSVDTNESVSRSGTLACFLK